MNAEVERINGLPRTELLGRDHWEIFPASRGTRIEHEFRRAVAEQAAAQFENYYEPWGRWFDVKAYPSRDGGLAVYFRDVTQRKQARQREQLLADASATFASSLDSGETLRTVADRIVPDLADLCFFDVVGRDGALHRAAWSCAVGTVAEGRLQEIGRFVPPPGHKDHPVARLMASGRTELVAEVSEAWLRSAATDGAHLDFLRELRIRSLAVAPIAARGKVLGALTLCFLERSGRRYGEAEVRVADVLARRAGLALDNAGLYQSAQDALAEAEAAGRMKDEFLATLSHELGTPLSAIVGWSRLLRSGQLDPKDVEQGLDVIDRNARIQAQLIEDLLDLSRIIAGTLRLDIQRVGLPDVIDAALATVQPAAEAKGAGS